MFKNGLYNITGACARLVLTFLTTPLLIRLMGVEEYGLWTLISTIIAVASLAEGGLSVSTTVFVARDLAKDDTDGVSQTITIAATVMLLFGTFTALLLYLSASSAIRLFSNLQEYQRLTSISALQVSTFVLWPRLIQQVLIGVEQAYQKYGLMNFLNSSQVALNSLGLIVVAWKGGEIVALMQWQAISSFFMLATHVWTVRSLQCGTKLKFTWNTAKSLEMLRYSFSTWSVSIGSALFQQFDRLIVGSILGTKALGIYAALTSITGQINSFSAMPIQPLVPHISSMLSKDKIDLVSLQKQVKKSFITNSLFALGIGGFLLTLAPIVVVLMLPKDASADNIHLFRIATVIYSIYSMNAIGYYILLSTDSVKTSLKIHLLSGTLSLALIAVLANYYGLLGSILGNAGYFGVWLLNITAMKEMNIKYKIWNRWIIPIGLWFGSLIAVNFIFPILSEQWLAIVLVLQSIFLVLEGLKLKLV